MMTKVRYFIAREFLIFSSILFFLAIFWVYTKGWNYYYQKEVNNISFETSRLHSLKDSLKLVEVNLTTISFDSKDKIKDLYAEYGQNTEAVKKSPYKTEAAFRKAFEDGKREEIYFHIAKEFDMSEESFNAFYNEINLKVVPKEISAKIDSVNRLISDNWQAQNVKRSSLFSSDLVAIKLRFYLIILFILLFIVRYFIIAIIWALKLVFKSGNNKPIGK
ncbi:MAG: hypothetical protein SGJ00_00830 [bacterium]|nr:hypothetical protein [bacterium]